MDDLSTQEWGSLPTEVNQYYFALFILITQTQTTQALIRETLAGRKNLSPQNLYETGQLYAAGALRVACVGLQCVGFSTGMYHAVLEQAALGTWHE